jgi:5'-deoxynucleotidase YfbR-like HD superfamily hydrolase
MEVKMLNKLNKRLLGGYVSRYHTRPEVADGQNVAAHTWGALAILTTLWEDVSREAMLYLLYHDVVESELGDLPAPTKWNYKNLDKAYSEAEAQQEEELELPMTKARLTEQDQHRVKMADMLELILHCKRQMSTGNTLATPIYQRGKQFLQDRYGHKKDFKPVQEILNELQLWENTL